MVILPLIFAPTPTLGSAFPLAPTHFCFLKTSEFALDYALSETAATMLWRFAKKHTSGPLLSGFGKFKLPAPGTNLIKQLQSLHRISSICGTTADHVTHVDEMAGRYLADAPANATELLDPKLAPPTPDAIADFDDDAKALAALVDDHYDHTSSTWIGLAYGIWFRSQSEAAPETAQGVAFQSVHKLLNQVQECNVAPIHKLRAFAQAAIKPKTWRDWAKIESLLTELLRRRDLMGPLLNDPEFARITTSDLLNAADFLLKNETQPALLNAADFLRQLSKYSNRASIIRVLGQMNVDGGKDVFGRANPFHQFRFPSGLAWSTANRFRESSSQEKLLQDLTFLHRVTDKSKVPYLSPDAQDLLWKARRQLGELAKTKPLGEDKKATRSAYGKRLSKLMHRIAGIDLPHLEMQGIFGDLMSRPKTLDLLLSDSRRSKLSLRLIDDDDRREAWAAAKLIDGINQFSPEEFSMISTCLCSGYLYDTGGRFCTGKTFRDFQAYIEQDIQNLRSFMDPNVPTPNDGHVRRLVSYVREFLIDPTNAHYTNFEVKRTIQLGH